MTITNIFKIAPEMQSECQRKSNGITNPLKSMRFYIEGASLGLSIYRVFYERTNNTCL